MTFYYRPTVAEAFASVEYIMTEVNYGWLFRSLHRWSASMMVLMMILHIFRVYLTGEIDPEYEKYLGLAVRLTVNDIAMDDKVIAVGVSSGINSHNVKAHITLAVNKTNGGKPVMSNYLTNWENLRRPLLLRGKITQVEFK